MLAIITKMTLTQVSTWFANARRRLKKENKMTWSPRNRSEEDGSGDEDIDVDVKNSGNDSDVSGLNTSLDDVNGELFMYFPFIIIQKTAIVRIQPDLSLELSLLLNTMILGMPGSIC